MKIIVAIKQVAVRDSLLRVAGSGRWIEEVDASWEINEPDAYALEVAFQLKEKHGGEVIAVCAGPARASSSIREALAKGADRAIHIEEEDIAALDALAVARLLAAAVAPEKPDLVLAGLQSEDIGAGQTGVVLAEVLDLPHATIIMEVARENGSLRVKRELEGGWFQRVEVPLPALLTIQSGISKLRYATLMGIKRAKNKEVKRFTAAELGVNVEPKIAIRKVYLPHRSKQAQLLEGSPREAAAKLVDKLKFEARVL